MSYTTLNLAFHRTAGIYLWQNNLQSLEYDQISNNIGFNQVQIHATLVKRPYDKSFSLIRSIYKPA